MVICDDRKSREIARHTYIHGGGRGVATGGGKKAMTISYIKRFPLLGLEVE